VHLHAYALAAGAAGVSLLALVQPSEAEIVYTPVDEIIGRQGTYKLDLNNDGIDDFIIEERPSRDSFASIQQLFARIPTGNFVKCASSECISTNSDVAAAIPLGARIGPGERGWIPYLAWMAFEELAKRGTVLYTHPWVNVTDRYLGLEFQINGETHYGWARLTVRFLPGPPEERTWEARLTGYAYETTADTAINAGQTEGDADKASLDRNSVPGFSGASGALTVEAPAVAEPAPLGALALGAGGLVLWRRTNSEGNQPGN
jgi:hypothetical protein